MRLILALLLSVSCFGQGMVLNPYRFGIPQAPGYFGNIESDGSPVSGYTLGFYGSRTWYNNTAVTTYTCPGAGLRTLTSLGVWAKTRGAPHTNVRLALYDTSLNLIAEWGAETLVNSATEQWWESSSLTGTTDIYGGVNYIIALTMDGSLVSIGINSTANATKSDATDYTGGFPTPIGALSGNSTRPVVRAYVTGGDGSGSPPPSPTNEVWYVDPSAAGSTQNGTTDNPYLSLNAAIAARCNKTFTLPIQIRCRTSGSVADTTRVRTGTLVSWVNSATNYLEIVAESGHRASASWDSTKYHLLTAFASGAGAGAALEFSRANIRVDGIQIGISSQAGQDAACEIVYWSQGQGGYMANCLIRGSNYSGAFATRGMSSINGINVYNTVICDLGTGTGGAGIKNHGNSAFYNLTVIGGPVGVDFTDGSSIAKNCYFQGTTAILLPGNATLTTVATSDSTGSVGLQNIAHSTANFTNVTPGTSDYHIVTGSALKDVGTDTSGDASPFNFTTDIDGVTRSGTWDVGADEF